MTTTAEPQAKTVITQPGVYDIDADAYHADPVPDGSLSSSGAKLLLPPSCPAKFRYRLDHPQPPNDVFEFGHAAHRVVLGAGPEVVLVDADDWRTTAAREQRKEARAQGKVPMLPHEYREVHAMARAIRRHPIASALFQDGSPERSLFWVDQSTGVWRRARLDWLRNPTSGRMLVVDYKTCTDASPEGCRRAIESYSYHQQGAWYVDAVMALGLCEAAAFLFVFQEKTPPYLVNVVQLDDVDIARGKDRNRAALNLYRDCVDTGRWPGYGDEVRLVSMSPWADREFENAVDNGEFNILETNR